MMHVLRFASQCRNPTVMFCARARARRIARCVSKRNANALRPPPSAQPAVAAAVWILVVVVVVVARHGLDALHDKERIATGPRASHAQ